MRRGQPLRNESGWCGSLTNKNKNGTVLIHNDSDSDNDNDSHNNSYREIAKVGLFRMARYV
jgi:hypothetical protein